jgi:hypothetical protein
LTSHGLVVLLQVERHSSEHQERTYIEDKDYLDYSPQDRLTYRAWLEPDSKEEEAREL